MRCARSVNEHDQREVIFIPAQKSRLLRDRERERACADRLTQIGFQRSRSYYDRPPQLFLSAQKLPKIVRTLAVEGWHVEAEGNIYREPGEFRIEVTSGIDWFELHGTVEFGESTASLPELLAALKRGETTVVLDDGALGLLPEEWLKKYGFLASLGQTESDHVRFTRSQERIAEFCRRHHIRKLSLFGSVLREDFGPDSDVDVLVEFEPGQAPGFAFFGIEEELSQILGRRVDFVETSGLRNPFRRHEILRTQEVVFGI